MTFGNHVYLCFDGDNDIHYFYLMKAWKHNQRDFFRAFHFYDAHEINYARDSSLEITIKRKLLERLRQSNLFVVLVGEQTRYLYRFVRWEIQEAIKRDIPIVVINLNGSRNLDEYRCPPILKDRLALHISFNQKIVEKALEEWGDEHRQHREKYQSGAYHYSSKIYSYFGL